VFWADLNPVRGHEQGVRRPVVVVQNDVVNPILDTVLVAPLTGNLKAADFLLTATLPAEETGLAEDSVALLFQIRTLDKRRLEEKIVSLPERFIQKMDTAIRLAFDV
jgi:mRNA interferase MazF